MNEYQTGIEGMRRLLDGMENPLASFTKALYGDRFQAYYQECIPALDAIEALYGRVSEKDQMLADMSGALVESANTRLAACRKRQREAEMIDISLIMAVYVLPSILRYEGESSRPLCDRVLADWKEAFPKSNLTAATFEEVEKGFHRKFCYITTAVCTSRDLPDDCYELQLLRSYRDGYLSSREDGAAEIRAYYDVAPTIVKHIDRRADSAAVYRSIFTDYIRPCLTMIEEGRFEDCRVLYRRMVEELKERYFYSA